MQRADCIWLIMVVADSPWRLASGDGRTLLSLVIQNGRGLVYAFFVLLFIYVRANRVRSSKTRKKLER